MGNSGFWGFFVVVFLKFFEPQLHALLFFFFKLLFFSFSLWFVGLHRFFLFCVFLVKLTNAQFHTNVYKYVKYVAQSCCEPPFFWGGGGLFFFSFFLSFW